MSRFIVFIVGRPLVVVLSIVVLSAFFAYGLLSRGVQLDVSPLGFVEHGSQSRTDFENARKNFGDDDYFLIAVVCDDVFARSCLARLRKVHEQITKTKGVAEVLSLVNAPYARSVNGVVSVEKLLSNIQDQQHGQDGDLENWNGGGRGDRQITIDEIRRLVTSDSLYLGNLISADSRTAAFNILLKSDLPTSTRHVITKELYDLARNAGFDQVYFAGDPFSQWRSTEAIKSDLRVFLPLTLVFIAILLWLCFRSVIAVVLPLLTIGIGLIWLMGLMAYFEAHFTILALMLPTLMLAIGCSYMVHVINQIGIVREKSPGIDKASLLIEALRFISIPVIVSALTIIAGFLSLVFTTIPAIRTTAFYSAIGAGFTMILSLTLIPAALMLMGDYAIAFRIGLNGGLVKLLENVGRWSTSNQKLLYAMTAIIIVLSAIGVSRIVIDIDYFHFSKPSSETSVGLAEINKRLSGAVSFDIIVEGKTNGAVETLDALRRISQLQAFAETRRNASGQGVDCSLSFVDFVKHLNRAFHDNREQFYDVPSDEKSIQELLSDHSQLHSFLTPDGRMARILVRSSLSGSQAMAGVIREIETKGQELLPDFRVYATGTFVLLNRTSDLIAGEQVQSVTIALVTIYLMLALLFRSLRVGFTALVPNLIPILFFFGFMGWRGIDLNLTTSLVASMVLGLAVDNAVQFIVRFRRVQPETPDLRAAILESMRLTGRPIIYANIALASTFAIFFFSNFKPIAAFGLLSAVTILGCLIEDLVLLPARLTSPVFRAK